MSSRKLASRYVILGKSQLIWAACLPPKVSSITTNLTKYLQKNFQSKNKSNSKLAKQKHTRSYTSSITPHFKSSCLSSPTYGWSAHSWLNSTTSLMLSKTMVSFRRRAQLNQIVLSCELQMTFLSAMPFPRSNLPSKLCCGWAAVLTLLRKRCLNIFQETNSSVNHRNSPLCRLIENALTRCLNIP